MTPRRTRIGLLAGTFGGGHLQSVWEGALCGAAEAGVDLLAFVGGALASPTGYDEQRTTAYALASRESIDAAVVLGDTIGAYAGRQAVERLVACIGVPRVALAAPLAGAPFVGADNTAGVRAAIGHLVERHGRRRIALIRGPEASAEASARYEAYRAALHDHDIPYDDGLVARGYLDPASGRSAIGTLVDADLARFDALVAWNDTMALGAMALLEARGIRVPDDVAVIGFDDVPESVRASPPLATVRQPSFDLGRAAVLRAAGAARGEPGDASRAFDVALMPRTSCGCALWAPGGAPDDVRDRMAREIARPGPDGIGPEEAARLVDAFARELAASGRGGFAAELARLLEARATAGAASVALLEDLALMRRETFEGVSATELPAARAVWQSARPQLGALEQRVRAHERTASYVAVQLREIGWELSSQRSVGEVCTAAERVVPAVGVSRFYVCTYEYLRPGGRARLACACDPSGRAELDDGDVFDAHRLLPRPLDVGLERRSVVVHPLFVKRRQIGYAVFEVGPVAAFIYEILARHLSVALAGVLGDGARDETNG